MQPQSRRRSSLLAEGPLDGVSMISPLGRETEPGLAWRHGLPSRTGGTGWGSCPRLWFYWFVPSLSPPGPLPPLSRHGVKFLHGSCNQIVSSLPSCLALSPATLPLARSHVIFLPMH